MAPHGRKKLRVGLVAVLVCGLTLFEAPPPPPADTLRLPSIDWTKPLDVVAAAPRLLAAGAQAAGHWLLGGIGAAPAAAAEDPAPDPADDGPATRAEVTSERSRDAKLYRNPDGSYTAEFGHGLHYEAAPGDWRQVDLDFRQDGNEWVADKNEVIVRVTSTGVKVTDRDTGKGVLWKIPAAATVSGRKATFSGPDGLSFTYSNTPDGLKLEAVVSEPIGAKTFAFDYTLAGGALPFTVDAEGNLHSDAFVVPRALATGANGETYVAGVWRIAGTKVAFDFDDSSFPPEAFPYVLDPSTTFGQDSNGDDGHVSRSGGTYPPTGTITSDTSSTRVYVYRSKSSGTYTVRNGFGRWPTASIPNAAVIGGATLRVQLTYHQADDDRALMAEWYTASNWPIDSTDYSAGALWGASGSAGWDIGSIASNGEVDFPLVGYATGISKTGDTGMRLHIESGQPSGENKIHFKAREDPDAGSAAKLIVTYNTAPGAPTSLKVNGFSSAITTPDSTPTLSGVYSDPDPGDDGYLIFEVFDSSDPTAPVWTNEEDPSNTAVASGQTSSFEIPPGVLEDSTTYTWRARSWDGEEDSAEVSGPNFTIDTSSLTGALTTPENGEALSGTVTLSATPNQGASVGAVRFYAISQGRKRLVGTDSSPEDGTYSVSFDTTLIPDGRANIRAEFASGADDLAYCCSPGAGAAVIVNNAAPGPEEWEASADADALASTENTDAGVSLSSGAVLIGVTDAEAAGRGFDASFQRIYSSASSAGGILGPGWRSNLEDVLAVEPDGDVVRVDGAGRERLYGTDTATKLKASFWNNTSLSGAPDLERYDSAVDFTWSGSPGAGVNAENFSARWEGHVEAPVGGTWTFYALSDDGARVLVDGNYVINNWVTQAAPGSEAQGSIHLDAGRHEIRVEYFKTTGTGEMHLSWSGPGTAKQVVPSAALQHATALSRPPGITDALARETDGSYTITSPDQMQARYLPDGRFDEAVDPHGNALTFSYDAQSGLPVFVCVSQATCDETTASLILSYDPDTERLVEVALGEDPTSAWTYSYDAGGRLAQVVDPEGGTTDYEYTNGRLSAVIDAEGGRTELTYASGRVSAIKDPVAVAASGPATTFDYGTDASGAPTVTVRAPEQNEDPQNPGPGEVYTVNDDGTLAAHAAPDGHSTSFEYDAQRNLARETDQTGAFEAYTWDQETGNLLSERNKLGLTTTYAYNDQNQLETVTEPGNRATDLNFAPNGIDVTEVIDPEGNKATFGYDAAGQVISEVDPRGYETGASPAAFTTEYTYTADGLPKTELGPAVDGVRPRTEFVYDAAGNLDKEKIGAGDAGGFTGEVLTTDYDYDKMGNLTREVDPLEGTTTYAYDDLGRVTTIVDPEGYEGNNSATDYDTIITYDKAGRVLTEADPLGNTTSYVYDWDGAVEQEIDPEGNVTRYVYDDHGQLDQEILPKESPSDPDHVIDYAYDELGRVESVTDPKGTTTYVYDALDRVISETVTVDGVAHTTTHSYDDLAGTETVIDPGGNVLGAESGSYRTVFQFDDVGRLDTITDAASKITDFGYDATGNETSITDPTGAVTEIAYDAMGRPVQRLTPGSKSLSATGSVDATNAPTDEEGLTTSAAGRIHAALSWDPLPALSTSNASGSLAEGAKVERTLSVHGESILEGDLTWTDGTKVTSQTFGPASLGAGATATHAVSVTATDAPITGSLTWSPTTKSISISDSVDALASETHDLTVNTPGRIQATLSWGSGLSNLDLELLDPAGGVVDDSKALTGTSETVDYTVPAGGPTGTYKLKVISLAASSTAYSISGEHPFFSNLNLELLKPGGQVAASAAASGSTQPEQLSYTPPAGATGTYTFRVTSQDQGTPSYTLATTRPVTATATVGLRLKDPGGTVVWSGSSASKTLNAIYSAPDPGGSYTFEIENLSADIDVPSWALAMRSTVVASGQRSGSLAEGASTSENVQAEDEGTVRASATWTDGTEVQSQTFGPASLGADATATHAVSVTATDAPITGSLTWNPTMKTISISDSVDALASETHDLTVNTTGRIQATLTWAAAIPNPNLDLELLDPAGAVVDDSKELTGNSETVDYTIPSGGTTGTYKLKVISFAPQATAYSISGSHPFFSNLNLELLKPNGQVAASSTASGSTQPEQLSYQPGAGETGTWTFRVTSQDQGTSSYTLATTRPVTATATVRLRLYNPAGTQVGSTQGSSNALSLSYRAPDPGGQYRVELTDVSTEIEIPSYTLHWKVPEAGRYADLDLKLLNSGGSVVASSARQGAENRPEVLSYEGPAGTYTLEVEAKAYEADWRLDYGVPTQQEEAIGYDGIGRVSEVGYRATTDPNSAIQTTSFSYDVANRKVEIDLPDGTTQRVEYLAGGRVKSLFDSATGTESFTYDRAGRVATATDTGNVTTSYTYDKNGNEKTITRAGETFSFGYDPLDRLEERTEGTALTSIAYADQVFPTQLTHPSGEQDARSFDEAGQIQALALRPGAGEDPSIAIEQDFDPQGNLEEIRDLTGPSPEVLSSYDYDGLDRLTTEIYELDGAQKTFTYAYDGQGNRTSVVGPGGATTTFAYNPAGQLISRTDPAGALTAYLYDERGNLQRAVGPQGTMAFTFSPEGTLDRITRADGTLVDFEYDASGKRTEKTASGTTTTYGYESGRLASLTRGSDIAVFAYDDAGTPLAIKAGGKTYAYRYDARGAVIELTDTDTHDPAASYRYDAWGQVVEETGDADLRALNPFTFIGAHGVIRDQETGLYLMGARYYDPGLGRFLARDPIEADSSMSSYVYAANNPLSFMDPDGTHPIYAGSGRCLRWCRQAARAIRVAEIIARQLRVILRFVRAIWKALPGLRSSRRWRGSSRERVLGVLDPCGTGRGISESFNVPRLGSTRWASFGMGCSARTFTIVRFQGVGNLFVPSDFTYFARGGGPTKNARLSGKGGRFLGPMKLRRGGALWTHFRKYGHEAVDVWNSYIYGGARKARNFFKGRVGRKPDGPVDYVIRGNRQYVFRPSSDGDPTVEIRDFARGTIEKIRFPG